MKYKIIPKMTGHAPDEEMWENSNKFFKEDEIWEPAFDNVEIKIVERINSIFGEIDSFIESKIYGT